MLQQKALPEEQGIMDHAVIMRVKHYIAAKHPGFTAEQREAVLSNALHRMIDVHLPEFEEGTRIILCQRLLARLEQGETPSLLPRDVLEVCLLLELEESAQAQLEVWMGKHQLTAAASLPSTASARTASFASFRRLRQWTGAVVLLLLLWAAGVPVNPALLSEDSTGASLFSPPSNAMPMPVVSDSPLPLVYTYHPVDTLQLKDWLQARNSLLADDPYFSAILEAAERNNLNPLLLFAITGQEQGYVPKENKQAKKIANNPFNVHHSWQSYNTGIADSAHIASKTILSISRTRPEGAHPIQWLNTRYAEDPEWWVGVNSIFEKLRREIPVLH